MATDVDGERSRWDGLYKPQWVRLGIGLVIVGFLAVLASGRQPTVMARWGVRMLAIGMLALVYAFTPAMGELMAGEEDWEDLSTTEQLIQATKWAFVGALVLFFGGAAVAAILP